MVGFTRLAAEQPPEAVIRLLRDYHARMAQAVFEHGGTLDEYLGDGIMATFGTPRPSGRDATNAVRAAGEMVRLVAAWNAERADAGAPPVRIGVGVHYGPVVLGNVGDALQLKFAVVGDTVNVASRLQELTRTLSAAVVFSQDLLDAARAEGGLAAADLDGLVAEPPQPIRGREQAIAVWTLRRSEDAARIHAAGLPAMPGG